MVRVRVRGIMQLLLRMRSSKELTKEQTKTMRILPRLRIFLFALNGAAMLMSNQASEAQDRSQGRSMVVSRNGIVAAESPLAAQARSEEHTSELQSQSNLVCRLLLEKKKN